MKDSVYFLHQTPPELCVELLKHIDLKDGDKVYEPFKGEGGFYNHFPSTVDTYYSEIQEGKDYKDFNFLEHPIDWVITNPPFQLEESENKRVNAFYYLLKYYVDHGVPNIAFLGNSNCFSSLTPKRLKYMSDKGYHIQKVIVCNIKKWRGRYYFIIIQKKDSSSFSYLEPSY